MRRLVMVAKAGKWPDSDDVDSVTLGFDDRHRRRLRLTTEAGESVLLDLTKPQPLDDGDGLAIENNEGWIRIKAAPEDVLEFKAKDLAHTVRLAWNLGNRHLPIQVLDDGRLRMRYDHVIEEMLTGLGVTPTREKSPFVPESNAFNRQNRRS
ncbi:MAG: urease accessory protein UreE [Alphaproteobacteria bacterium]|nr:urease accessory protein UreE [Alphaproteobacteria bacterium]